jgi:hypothetical protein
VSMNDWWHQLQHDIKHEICEERFQNLLKCGHWNIITRIRTCFILIDS